MHNEQIVFLKELSDSIHNYSQKEYYPDAMLLAVYSKYGPQVAHEFGGLVYTVLKAFGEEADTWEIVCKTFFSSESDKIEGWK